MMKLSSIAVCYQCESELYSTNVTPFTPSSRVVVLLSFCNVSEKYSQEMVRVDLGRATVSPGVKEGQVM